MSSTADVTNTVLAMMDTAAEQISDIPARAFFYAEFMRHLVERQNDFDFEVFEGQDEAWDEALTL